MRVKVCDYNGRTTKRGDGRQRSQIREIIMAHILPQNPALRELFDVATDLVPIGTGERQAPTFGEAKANAIRSMKAYKGIAAITAIVIRANDDLELVEFGPRGRATTLWNFTTG